MLSAPVLSNVEGAKHLALSMEKVYFLFLKVLLYE